RYLIQRKFAVEESEMPDVGRRSRVIVEQSFPEITWEHSHVIVDESGNVTTFCIYGAPDEVTVRQHADMLGQHEIELLAEIASDARSPRRPRPPPPSPLRGTARRARGAHGAAPSAGGRRRRPGSACA